MCEQTRKYLHREGHFMIKCEDKKEGTVDDMKVSFLFSGKKLVTQNQRKTWRNQK